MAVTGSCADVFFLTLPEEIEIDAEDGVAIDGLVSEFRTRFTPVPDDERLDADVEDNVF